jgi:integrase/recombinase XerD
LGFQDAVTLERDRLSPEGYIVLRRTKTTVSVFIPLPPRLVSALRNLPSSNPRYFFWTGKGHPRSATKSYQRSLAKLFRLANIMHSDGTHKRCHSHMFRHTFAIELLLSGEVKIEQISALLGHRSIKITEKHYLPWVKARQEELVSAVQHSWIHEDVCFLESPQQPRLVGDEIGLLRHPENRGLFEYNHHFTICGAVRLGKPPEMNLSYL